MKKYIWFIPIFCLLDGFRVQEPKALSFTPPETAAVVAMIGFGFGLMYTLLFLDAPQLKARYGVKKVYAYGAISFILAALGAYSIHVYPYYFELIIATPFEWLFGRDDAPVLILSTLTIRDFLIFVVMVLYTVGIFELCGVILHWLLSRIIGDIEIEVTPDDTSPTNTPKR